MHGRGAVSQLEGCEPGSGRWMGLAARRLGLAALATLMLLFGAASLAHAASFYWYGENNSTCWQTGQPGRPSQKCEEVGPSYLLSHLNGNYNSPSGDYCVSYNIGEALDTTNENNQSAFSGFTPPSPLGSYQEGNHYGGAGPDVCQAAGSKWGQVLRGNSANDECESKYAPCGMQHVVSFGSQGLNDRPWGENMQSPALVVSAEANPHKVEAPNSWGYLCLLLKEAAGGHLLEFCLEQWHVGSGQFPALHEFNEATEPNNGLGQVITAFKPGMTFAEMVPGSAETFEFTNNPSPRTFTARITSTDLVRAIEALEKKYGPTEKSSHNASEYALVGVTQGVEGGGLKLIGSETANLKVWSEYTARPTTATPYSFREPSTGNEDIFFRGVENALWQDAWTSSGGWKLNHIGGTLTSDPMGFIEPNGTMNIFYRGENNAIWQAYRNSSGAWSTYEVLPGAPLSSGKPYGYMESNGTMNIFYCSTSHVISQLYYTGSGWTDPGMAVGEAAPCEGDPVALTETNGNQNVFYRTTTGSVGQVWWASNIGWHSNPLGGDMVGTPTALQEPNGNLNVFFHKAGNELGQWWLGSSGWDESPLGGIDLQNPVAFMGASNVQNVFYVNSYGTIARWWWEEGSGWHQAELGEGSEGSPTGFAQPNGNLNVYFFEGGTGAIDQWLYSGGKWNLSTVCSGPCGSG
jgi:hypothetical protein